MSRCAGLNLTAFIATATKFGHDSSHASSEAVRASHLLWGRRSALSGSNSDTAQRSRKDARAPVFYAAVSPAMPATSRLGVVGSDLILGHHVLKAGKQVFCPDIDNPKSARPAPSSGR